MSCSSETVPILANSSVVNEVHSALSVACSDSSAEDVPLVPEVVFESTLDSPGLNRESQPLLGGLDVSYNQFPGKYVSIFVFIRTDIFYLILQMIKLSAIWSGKVKLLSTMAFFRNVFLRALVDHILLKILQGYSILLFCLIFKTCDFYCHDSWWSM